MSAASAFIAILILLTSSFTFISPAFAAEGRDLSNDLITSANVSRYGDRTPNQPLQSGEVVNFSFSWDGSAVAGTDKAPKAGDYIKIDAPQWLRFTGAKVDMKDPNGNVVAKCVEEAANPTSVTCTFTDFVETNPANLKGDYATTMIVQPAQTIADKTFRVGPVELNVTNLVNEAASGVIVGSNRTCKPLTDEIVKTGGWEGPTADSNGQARLWWDLKFPGTGEDVKIADSLLLPQTHGKITAWVRDGATESDTRCTWHPTNSNLGAATEITRKINYNWSKTPEGEDSVSIVVPNTEVGKHYRVVIYAFVPADAFKAGSSLTNEAAVNDQNVSGSVKATKVTNASASGNPELGGVWVYKKVTGNAKDLVPSDTSYTLKATWIQDGVEKTENLTVNSGNTPAKLENLPKGTKVTFSELKPADGAGYSWGDPIFADGRYGTATSDQVVVAADKKSAVVTIMGGENWPIQVTNTANLQFGKFSIVKNLEGTQAAKDLVPADAEFVFDYSYPAGPGFKAGSGTISVKADGTAVESTQIPVGAEVTIAEQTPAPVNGIAWAEPRISPATFTVEKDQVVNVLVTNPVAETLGGFSLVKKVSGTGKDLVPAGSVFSVDYSWTTADGQSGNGVIDVTAGAEPVVVSGIPAAATVTLSEHTPAEVAGVKWLDPIFSTNGFSVIAGETVAVDLDNPTQLNQGAFAIRKEIIGSGAQQVPADASFTVNYSYPAGKGFEAGEGTLIVKADGTITQSDPLPYGAVVTLTEITPADIADTKWLGGEFDKEVITIGDGTLTQVVLTNTYEEVPPPPGEPTKPTPGEPTKPTPGEPTKPTPGEPTKPTPGEPTKPTPEKPSAPKSKNPILPRTGAEVAGIGATALILLVGGIALLVARARKNSR